MAQPVTQQDTQPPAETLAEAREAAALAFDARARKASHPEVVTLERHHAKVIRAGEGDDYDAVQAALIALTRRAGGDAIPAGMKPWHGGDEAPADWDGGPVFTYDDSEGGGYELQPPRFGEGGECWQRHNNFVDIIAYTPKPPAGGDAVAVERYRQALEDVCNPISYLQRLAEAEGAKLGGMAYSIANDVATLQRIARDALALPAPVVEGDDETVAGRVIWHTSEEGGGPDVGISVGLGNGASLFIGDLLDRDGGPVGIVFHGPGGVRHAARLSELDEVRDLFEQHVARTIAALSGGRSHG